MMEGENGYVLLAISGPRRVDVRISQEGPIANIVIKGDSRALRVFNQTRDAVGKFGAAQRRVARAEAEYRNVINKAENKRRAHWRKHAGRPKSRRR